VNDSPGARVKSGIGVCSSSRKWSAEPSARISRRALRQTTTFSNHERVTLLAVICWMRTLSKRSTRCAVF
jgi:hypothetical protein